MENNNSNSNVQLSTAQPNLSIGSHQSTADSIAFLRIRASKRVKLENWTVDDLAGSHTANLYCDVCDLAFTESSGFMLHIQNSSCHDDLARDPEKRKIGAQVEQAEQAEQVNNVEHQTKTNSWSKIPAHKHPQLLEALQARCHSSYDLQKRKYVLREYTGEDCAGLAKCTNCRRYQCDLERREDSKCTFHAGKRSVKKPGGGERWYSCCGKPGEGCETRQAHTYGSPDPKYQEYSTTPPRSLTEPRRKAIALDCEMATVRTSTVPYRASELIFLCAIDYLTGETLINTHVSPQKKVIDWCTEYSGVTAQTMAEAKVQGQTLNGWQDARFELWKYIDADTVLVGQSLQNDLEVLRMVHTRVVDSAILTRLAVGCSREWGLKVLCDELLGMKIQTLGKKGHVCAEDTFATREVVLLCCQCPERLEAWATVKRKEQEEQQRIQKEALDIAKSEKSKLKEAQQKMEEEALEKTMIEKVRMKEQQSGIRNENLDTVNGSVSEIEEEGLQDKEDERRKEVRREKGRRKRRRRQERKSGIASKLVIPERSVSSSLLGSDHTSRDDSDHPSWRSSIAVFEFW